MPPTTRGTTAPRRKDKNSIVAPLESPDGSENLQLPTPKRRKRGPTDDDYLQFARELVADDTEAALRAVGHEDDSSVFEEERWCVCGIAEDDVVSVEDMIRCDNRQCTPGWFHLRCVKLPSHPPSKFGWFCKDCIKACNVGGEAVNGLICQRGEDGQQKVKEWLVKEDDRRERKRNWKRLMRTMALREADIQESIEKDGD